MAEILNHPQVYSFLHVPVQAGSNQVLNDMKREYTNVKMNVGPLEALNNRAFWLSGSPLHITSMHHIQSDKGTDFKLGHLNKRNETDRWPLVGWLLFKLRGAFLFPVFQ